MHSKFSKIVFIIIIAAANLIVAAAHDYHSTLTRIDLNEKENNLEISIQMFTHDVVVLLEKRTGKKIDLGKSADADAVLQKYLEENFILKTKSGTTAKLNWVGKEVDVGSVWVYLETPWTEDLFGASLQNTLFFEYFGEQANLVIARRAEKKADLVFKVGDKFKDFVETKSANR